MAGAGMTFTHLDPAARRVLEQYTAELAAGLAGPRPVRAAIVAEIADGLTETTAAHQRSGLPPAAAARAAVAEFGDAQLIAAGFGPELAADTGRRIGLGLLATGPLVGLAWLGTALASSDTAGISPPAGLLVLAIVFGAILAVAVPAAGVSVLATGRVSRWLPIGPATAPTAAGLAAMLCMAGDLLLLAGLVAWATTHGGLAWPPAVLAATVSASRLTLAGRAARRCVAAAGCSPEHRQTTPGHGPHHQRDPDQAGQHPEGNGGEPVPQWQVRAVVDVEAGEQRDVGAAHAQEMEPQPAPPPTPAGQVAQTAGGERDHGDQEQVPVLAEPQQGHDGGRGEHHGQGPEVAGAGDGVPAWSFGGGGGQRAGDDTGQAGRDVAGEGSGEDDASGRSHDVKYLAEKCCHDGSPVAGIAMRGHFSVV
jgi:hypothetical protein